MFNAHDFFDLNNREKKIIGALIIFVVSIFLFATIYVITRNIFSDDNVSTISSVDGEVSIHILDTGNSDCILIKGEKIILIDGADNDDENMIVSYLKKESITTIDYMISTHYHKDHLGSLDRVIKDFDVKNVLVSNATSDIPSYKDFINALNKKKLKKQIPVEGEKIELSKDSYMKIYNTNGGTYVNDECLVTLLVNGNDKFLFTADAEKKAEFEILDKLEEVDVIKIGHHGSSSSTTDELLNVTKPKFAIITDSETNPYANPSQIVMQRLKERNIEVHRTDECGHIVFRSTGNGVHTNCPVGSYNYRTVEQIKGKKAAKAAFYSIIIAAAGHLSSTSYAKSSISSGISLSIANDFSVSASSCFITNNVGQVLAQNSQPKHLSISTLAFIKNPPKCS